MSTKIEQVKDFWDAHPCESTLSEQRERSVYFTEIQCKRYQLESHIPILAKFDQFRNRDVLEIGCGIGCDGLQFARNGARYVGVDLSPKSVQHAREQFELFGTSGRFEVMNAAKLDFASAAFDHVYSFGVIHHSPDTDAIVREIYRVFKPGGTFPRDGLQQNID
jgi:ubiquinone/menaquinone biosynthesis C-methylase UbiE